ncbi:MAG TPA: phosphatase PAP2 family protein [Mycobacteriales bacterium]|nr:phosphatase PAP2 family protein [Mycobacteriales bacterium]
MTLTTISDAASPAAPEPGPEPAHPDRLHRALAAVARRRGLREFLLIAVVYVMYDGSRFIVEGQQSTAFAHALRVLNIEQGLDLAWEQTLNAWVSAHAVLAVPADYIYATLHYVVTPIVLVWMWRCHRDAYPRARTALVVATVIGLIGFSTIPVAPPRMLPGFVDTMAQYSTHGWWGANASAPRGFGSYTNQFAAMPSLHVGWALWCGWQLIRHGQHRLTKISGLLYPTVITIVVIATGNHYFLDVVAGMGVVFIAMGAVGGVARLLPQRPRPEPQRRVIDLRAVEAPIPSQGGR